MDSLSDARMVAVLLVALGRAAVAGAQEPRLTIAPLVGWSWSSALFEHDYTTTGPAGPGASSEELTVDAAAVYGARVGLRVAGPWTIGVSGTTSSSRYYYHYTNPASGTFVNGNARIAAASLTLARSFPVVPHAVNVDVYAGGTLQKFDIRQNPGCGLIPPPSLGSPAILPCSNWQKRYSVPGGLAGLAATRRLTNHFAVRVDGSYALQRADTKVFWVDLLPQYDQYEAPKSVAVHTVGLSVDLSYSP